MQELLLIAGNIGVVVTRRVGIDVDPQRLAVQTVVNRERQTLDRPQRQIVNHSPDAGEIHRAGEGHHVDAHIEQDTRVGIAANVPANIGQLIALVFEAAAHPIVHLPENLAHCHAGPHGQPQRQNIRGHAGDCARSLAPRRHRNADHNVVGAVAAMHEHRCRRHHHPGEIDTRVLRQRAQAIHQGPGQMRGFAQNVLSRRRTAAVRRIVGIRPRREGIGPVRAIRRHLPGRAIRRIFGQQSLEAAERRRRRQAVAEMRVNIGDAARHQPHRKPIHDDVVIARKPEEPLIRHLEQRERKQRIARQVDRAREVGPHQRFGGGAGVRLAADVDDRQRP